MHHEVLLATLGFTGDVIVETKEGLQLAPDLPFFTPAEREATNRVVRLGYYYKGLRSVVDNYRYAGTFAPPDEGDFAGLPYTVRDRVLGTTPSGLHQGSLYIQALCIGIDDVLSSYEADVADLEAEIIRDVHLPTSYLHHRLSVYQTVLPALHHVVERVLVQQWRGARIMELLYQEAQSGNTQVRDLMQDMLRRVQGVFVHQLKLWTLHGILRDPFDEFFVRVKASAATAHSDRQVGHHVGGAPSLSSPEGEGDDNAEYEWKWKHELRREAAPLLFFPATLATRVFFLGRAVRVLDRKRGRNPDGEGGVKDGYDAGARGSCDHGALREEEVASFSKRWDALKSQETMDLLALQLIIDDIYKVVAARLWALLMEKKGLPSQIQVIRDVFLLGRGSIFQTLIEDNREMLLKAPSPSAEFDLSLSFSQLLASNQCEGTAPPTPSAMGRSDDEQLGDRLFLVVNPPTFSTADFHHFATSIFRLAGDASFVAGSGTLRLGQRGAGAWSRGRKAVFSLGGQGMCTSFSVRKAAGQEDESAEQQQAVLSLVLHNDHVPPQVVAEGIQHSITVQLRFRPPSPTGQVETPLLRVYAGRSMVGERRVAVWKEEGEGAGKAREVTVDCTSRGQGKGWVLRVFVDDPEREESPVLAVPLDGSVTSSTAVAEANDAPDALGPEGASQGAYMGLVSQGGAFEVHTWSLGTSRPIAGSGPLPTELSRAQRSLEAQELWARGSIQLDYRVGWPLQLVVTQESLNTYNQLFSFLFQLRRMGYELERLWPLLTRFWRDRMALDRSLMLAMLALRARIAYVIDNITYYMQVDVIDARFTALQSELGSVQDFDAMLRLHRSFYLSLLSRAFLVPSMAPVSGVIDSLLSLARRFTVLCDHALSSDATLLETDRMYRRALFREVSAVQQALSEKTRALQLLLERSEGKELALRLEKAEGESN